MVYVLAFSEIVTDTANNSFFLINLKSKVVPGLVSATISNACVNEFIATSSI